MPPSPPPSLPVISSSCIIDPSSSAPTSAIPPPPRLVFLHTINVTARRSFSVPLASAGVFVAGFFFSSLFQCLARYSMGFLSFSPALHHFFTQLMIFIVLCCSLCMPHNDSPILFSGAQHSGTTSGHGNIGFPLPPCCSCNDTPFNILTMPLPYILTHFLHLVYLPLPPPSSSTFFTDALHLLLNQRTT